MSCNLVYRARNNAKELKREANRLMEAGDIEAAGRALARSTFWSDAADRWGCPPDPVDSEP